MQLLKHKIIQEQSNETFWKNPDALLIEFHSITSPRNAGEVSEFVTTTRNSIENIWNSS